VYGGRGLEHHLPTLYSQVGAGVDVEIAVHKLTLDVVVVVVVLAGLVVSVVVTLLDVVVVTASEVVLLAAAVVVVVVNVMTGTLIGGIGRPSLQGSRVSRSLAT
jgi:hypothetical protein